MINYSKKLGLTSFIKSKIAYLLAFLVLASINANSQNIISVSFKDGAIGTQGSNPQQLNNLQNFQSLQVTKAYFIQNSGTNQFFAQGNDIPGVLRVVTSANKFVDIQGAIVWREGNNPLYIGFIPDDTNTFSLNLNTYGGANYNITENSNFAILFNNKSFTFVNGASLSGNAATTSVLNDLNAYLTTFNSSRPAGPVTVNTQTTSSTTPSITGTATLASGESLSIELNGVVYTTEITFNGSNWTWTVPNSANLTPGTYSVVATITNLSGYILSDNTSNELTISAAGVPTIGVSASELSAFSACSGSVSAEQNFVISGTSLTANTIISAPVGFEVSLTSGTGFSSSVTASIASGILNATTIYVRMSASASGTPSGNITVTSGSESKNVAVTGTVNALPDLQFKLSAPNVTTSAIQGQVGTKTEDFNSGSPGIISNSGTFTIGSYQSINPGNIQKKASDVWGGSGSQYMGIYKFNNQDSFLDITLTEPSRYVGFWWGAGDAANTVTIYGTCGGNEIQLGQFTAQTVLNLLSGTSVIAVDGKSYLSSLYRRTDAANESFSYINLELSDPSIFFTRLVFGGGGFEVDNITTGTGYGAASYTIPSAPTITSVTGSNGSASINFTAPTSDGGTPITNYEYTTDGGTTWTAFSPAVTSSPVTITGLVNGTNYPFQLRAVNVIGPGPASNIISATIDSGLDSDGDNIPDANDSDDDNDGILDYLELDCSANTAVSESLNPSPFYFVQWNSFSNGVLSGVINVPGDVINVTVTNSKNSILLQNDNPYGGTALWTPLPSGNASLSTFRSSTLGEHKFVFDKPVNNPRFFINSLNRTLDLSLPGKILKSNGKFTGTPDGTTTQVLVGNEGTGTISFSGNITEISFTGREYEFYCNFSLGISGLSDFSSCVDKDTDGDGTPDRLDLDSDGDGVSDAKELADGTSPTNLCSFKVTSQTLTPTATWKSTDCDGDGVDNETELADKTSPTDLCSFVSANQSLTPTATWNTTDCDGDGFDNKTELDRGSDPLVSNVAPTNISLNPNAIIENAASGTTVGTLSSTDADAGDTHTYALVSGTGSTDNALFTIDGTSLKTTIAFNFEVKNSYTIRIRTTDAGGLSYEKVITLTVSNVNEAPTDLELSKTSINENNATGAVLGTLSSTDPDTGDTHTYALVAGTGSTDNALFTLDGNNLKTTIAFDFETKSSYSVRIRTTDAGGLSYEKAITITVLDVNDAPTNLALSQTSTNENNAIGFVIGQLSSTDQDAGDTHTYTLVAGTGSTDNALFTIDGNNLKTTIAFDFETKSSYSVRLRTTDAGGLTYDKVITITVLDINDAPTNIASSQTSIYEKNAVGAVIGDLSTTDQDAGDKHSYTLVSGDVAAFKISGNQLLANMVFNYATKNSYEVVIKSTDAGGLSVNKSIKITILQSPVLLGSANLAQNKQSSAVGQNVTISKGYSANLNLSASNIVKYAWSPSTGLSATNISNPIAKPTQTTTYTVTVTNAQGVSTNVYITVTVLEDYNITPNNVISPDGDGVNDFWTIENLSTYPNNEVKIFDKAGRVIFNVRNYQNNWNGQLNGQILHEGAYYYIINLGPGTRPKVGYITLFSNK